MTAHLLTVLFNNVRLLVINISSSVATALFMYVTDESSLCTGLIGSFLFLMVTVISSLNIGRFTVVLWLPCAEDIWGQNGGVLVLTLYILLSVWSFFLLTFVSPWPQQLTSALKMLLIIFWKTGETQKVLGLFFFTCQYFSEKAYSFENENRESPP